MTTLITGGTGLIGVCLAEKLLARGERVALFDWAPAEWRIRHLAAVGDGRLRVARGDVVSLVDLMETVRAEAVTAIVHLAYVLGAESNDRPELATRVNILGTTNVLEAARLSGVERVLLASSIAVYGADGDYPAAALPLGEDAPLYVARGLPIYGAGKVYLEHLGAHYARRYGLTVAGLRPSIVYGWGRQRGASAFAGELVDCAAVGAPVTVGSGDASVSLVYVDDVAEQFLALLKVEPARLARRRFFNTGGDTCTVRELAATVRRLLPDARIEVTSAGERDLAGLVAQVTDRSLEEEIGVRRRFTPLEAGLRAHIEIARLRAQQGVAVEGARER
ncbi:MAG: NAD(P)-dependent oxidoreductase [Candidatus Rokubacteria bacterium]|nr:NAD(P)-dependent oxidoreductase [Candidatus Rokubacteria bacterium]